MVLGIVICLAAATLIGSTGMSLDGFDPVMLIGFIAAFVCALGWGIEGAMGGYACSMVDTEVAITIRQVTSGIGNGIVLVSILSLIGGDGIGTGISMVGQALTDMPSIWLFLIGGIFASWSFKYWYKGAAMCGAASRHGMQRYIRFLGPCMVLRDMRTGIRCRRICYSLAGLGRSYCHGYRYLRSRDFTAKSNCKGGVRI